MMALSASSNKSQRLLPTPKIELAKRLSAVFNGSSTFILGDKIFANFTLIENSLSRKDKGQLSNLFIFITSDRHSLILNLRL